MALSLRDGGLSGAVIGVMDDNQARLPVMLWRRLTPAWQDVLLALAVAATAWGGAVWEASTPLQSVGTRQAPDLPVLLAVLCVTVAGPLVVRRRLPVTAALGSLAAALLGPGLLGLLPTMWPVRLAAALAFCSAAYHRPRRFAVLLAVSLTSAIMPMFLATPFSGWVGAAGPPGIGPSLLAQAALIGVAPVATGYALRLRRERAEQLALLYQEQAARAVAEERAWIAREIHDAVGHHLTAIRMQAGAAAHVQAGTSPLATSTFRTIIDLAATALRDIRLLLDALRDDGHTTTSMGATLGLDDLPALAARLSTPACRIEVTRTGQDAPLAALVDHCGYRLVQEALTNAVRHAGATRADVRVHRERDCVTLVVEDDGPTTPPPHSSLPGPGTGLHGMRERARLLGGALSIAPRVPHGWRIHAVLPDRSPSAWEDAHRTAAGG
ncbi:sensor histidine kinase [Nonomuraea sp. SYSU D8015]|uniref:sensor histidine kinase n=1 Tax=Nonomuraea sp. SYSU D8015 TaxID=2593644 RepID=UPI001660F855|nr:sensor histidine kinase [Nonomuraea sp. SYSU D8015]